MNNSKAGSQHWQKYAMWYGQIPWHFMTRPYHFQVQKQLLLFFQNWKCFIASYIRKKFQGKLENGNQNSDKHKSKIIKTEWYIFMILCPTRNINERLACYWYGAQRFCKDANPNAAATYLDTIWKKILSVQAQSYSCTMGKIDNNY